MTKIVVVPKCLVHRVPMVIDSTGTTWTCPRTFCNFTRSKKTTMDVSKRVEVKAKRKLTSPATRPEKKVNVRKPKCPLHPLVDMVFDPARGAWKCQEDGCRMIARPPSDADSESITLGKGQIHLRVFVDMNDPNATPTMVLMADNNVAIDITPFVSSFVDVKGYFETHVRVLGRDPSVSMSPGGKATLELNFDAYSVFRGNPT